MAAIKLPVNWRRRLRFFTLQRIVLPLAIGPFRLLVRSWRVDPPYGPDLQAAEASPRLIIVTWHGMLLYLLRYVQFVLGRGRRPVMLVSPSLDGQLAVAMLTHFGVDYVWGTRGARGVSGSRRFIERVASGEVGIIAADGPRGPCGVAKLGVLELAALADARLLIVTASTSHGLGLGAWDRSSLPLPFARLNMKLRMFAPPPDLSIEAQLQAMQSEMTAMAQAIQSPVSSRPPA